MVLRKLWDLYRNKVFPLASTDTLFNQYRDEDPRTDQPGGHRVRCRNLRRYLQSYHEKPTVLVLGEAAGPWGMRFSGVPFTSERQLDSGELPFEGEASSLPEPSVTLPRRSPYSSGSATIFWRVMRRYYPTFLVLDAVPFYPHKRGDLLRKGTPSQAELSSFSQVTETAVDILRPGHVVAVGERAASVLAALRIEAVTVHHTAHDTKREFPAGMNAFFGKLA